MLSMGCDIMGCNTSIIAKECAVHFSYLHWGDVVLDVLMVTVQFPPRSWSARVCGACLLMLVTRVLSKLLSLYGWTWECAVHVSLLLIVSMIALRMFACRHIIEAKTIMGCNCVAMVQFISFLPFMRKTSNVWRENIGLPVHFSDIFVNSHHAVVEDVLLWGVGCAAVIVEAKMDSDEFTDHYISG